MNVQVVERRARRKQVGLVLQADGDRGGEGEAVGGEVDDGGHGRLRLCRGEVDHGVHRVLGHADVGVHGQRPRRNVDLTNGGMRHGCVGAGVG